MSPGITPDLAYAAAVAGLPRMTPHRLRALLRSGTQRRTGRSVWEEILGDRVAVAARLGAMRSFGPPERTSDARPTPAFGGELPSRARRQDPHATALAWSEKARAHDVAAGWELLASSGTRVVRLGDGAYPSRLRDDDFPPELLFVRGDLATSELPAAAIVGTRKATHYGREVAAELGAGLARAGVCVVSGLAIGIDSAAHEGALAPRASAGPLAVSGGGVDVVYPLRNRRLAERIAAAGAIISEAPPGATPEAWRFPLRNRIIAALAQTVVVVESTLKGGSMHTVEAALSRGRQVFAVPGSVTSPASEGTNELLASGALVARNADDVIAEVEMRCLAEGLAMPLAAGRSPHGGDGHGATATTRLAASGPEVRRRLAQCSVEEHEAYSAVDEHPTPIDVICERTSLRLGAAALALDRLAELGLVVAADGAWRRR
ncbi:MAG: DNA-processing protein DprA [Acidimicrobiales bacterium]